MVLPAIPLIPIILALLVGGTILSIVALIEPLSMLIAGTALLLIFLELDRRNVFSKNELIDKTASTIVAFVAGYIIYKMVAAFVLLAITSMGLLGLGLVFFMGIGSLKILVVDVVKNRILK